MKLFVLGVHKYIHILYIYIYQNFVHIAAIKYRI